ncbi:unnamed protein product, partial [Meganyctiphanes norvegica]
SVVSVLVCSSRCDINQQYRNIIMGKLKGVPAILSPEILHLLAITGHGDQILLADINYPTHSICSAEGGPREIRADGLGIPALLDAITTLMPLDQYVESPIQLMERTQSDIAKGMVVPVWQEYRKICDKNEQPPVKFEMVERMEFYERSRKVMAIIHTGETAAYGNIILTRGVCN